MNKNIQYTAIILGVIAVNFIGYFFFFRLDFTADKRYTLSKATIDIISELDSNILVTAYFSDDLPAELINAKQDFEDLLSEYSSFSKGKIQYKFFNPNESAEKEQDAQRQGIRPLIVSIPERDQMRQMRVYMGAVVSLGEKTDVLAVIQPGVTAEHPLTVAIKKITSKGRAKIGILGGHLEADAEQLFQVTQQLSVLYEVEYMMLKDSVPIDVQKYKTIAIFNPKGDFSEKHLQLLDDYLRNGGNIFLCYNNIDGDLRSMAVMKNFKNTIEEWLKNKGVSYDTTVVFDANCGRVMIQQQQGPFSMNVPMQFPYFPIINNFADHPAVKGLEGMIFGFTSPLVIEKNRTNITPLAFTSEMSGIATLPQFIKVEREWKETDFGAKPQIMAVAITEPIPNAKNAKMIVVANGEFALNIENRQVAVDNINFAANAIDWLSDDTGLIELRTKGVTSRFLATISDNAKTILQYLNVVAPILLILLYGLYRRGRNKAKQQQWREGKY